MNELPSSEVDSTKIINFYHDIDKDDEEQDMLELVDIYEDVTILD